MHTRTAVVAVLALFLAVTGAESRPREEVNLDGAWEYVRVPDLTTPPEEGWQPITVPGLLQGVDYERAWFRRDFTVPDTMKGLRLVLHFGGVKYNSTVLVNGTKAGGHFGGYEPFDIDITDLVKYGENNSLVLGCHDWTGIFSDNETDFSVMQERPTEARSVPRDKILAPIGGHYGLFGPWDGVSLHAHPSVWVSDLFIKPSVRTKALLVDYELSNATAEAVTVTLAPEVLDEGRSVLSPAGRSVTIPANDKTTVSVQQFWDGARHWSHEDPYLYLLRTRLIAPDGDTLVDELDTRFGFREFWVEGGRFYLNGSRINLLATSWWPPNPPASRDDIEDRIRAIKNANCVIFRTHTQPWPELWYEVADEMGLMMIPEGAVWNDDTAYRVEDPVFWDNYAAHLRAMVDRDKNKPSVVMYSLENEMHGSRMNDKSPAKADLVRMGRLVKQWDPTRPIMYESDGDPDGVADVIGIHYPREYPGYTLWPNDAYWMDEPAGIGHMFLNGQTQWLWDREKPVYVGEFLWIPSSDPSWDTVFFGDVAYEDYRGTHIKAKGLSWKMAIEAYRHYEVGGISPWTMVEGGQLDEQTNAMYAAQKAAMQPIAAFLREYDHSFYSGAEVTRTADVYNDILSPSELTVRWALLDGAQRIHEGHRELSMEPGERREISFSFAVPQVGTRRELSLEVSVDREGAQRFHDTRRLSVFPPLALEAPGVAVGLHDPTGATKAVLARNGLTLRDVPDLAAIPNDLAVLVLGDGALQPRQEATVVVGSRPGAQGGLSEFIREGGRVLALPQTHYPPDLGGVTLSGHASTMTFAQMPGHPLLQGVLEDDLKFWAPDNIVTQAEAFRPTQGGFEAVVVSGSAAGIDHAPLLVRPIGSGVLLTCQMRLTDCLGVEPTAGVLLQNALDYLAAYRPRVARTARYCPQPTTREFVDTIGLSASDITASPGTAPWDEIDLLVACAPFQGLTPHTGRLEALLQRGGTILLHGVSDEEAPELEALLGEQITMLPYRGPVTRAPGDHELSSYFANEDLYWLGEAKAAHSWATKPLDQDMADFVLGRTLTGKNPEVFDTERLTLAGQWARDTGDGIILPSGNDVVSAVLEAPAEGLYIIGVEAGGTAAEAVWPGGTISVDGKRFGDFYCRRGEYDTYTVFGSLAAGEHTVQVRINNDYQSATEDRNLKVRRVMVAHDEAPQDVAYLSSPPAVAVLERGSGRIVVDNINWDRTETSARKASRYLCGLLTGLGARFSTGTAAVLEGESMEPQPEMPHYTTTGGAANLAAGGWIRGRVRCEAAGPYVFRIIARGTPLDEVYPIVALQIDGRHIADVQLTGSGWRAYPLEVELTEGEHELTLLYTNDEYRPPQDRNLSVDKIEIRPAEDR